MSQADLLSDCSEEDLLALSGGLVGATTAGSSSTAGREADSAGGDAPQRSDALETWHVARPGTRAAGGFALAGLGLARREATPEPPLGHGIGTGNGTALTLSELTPVSRRSSQPEVADTGSDADELARANQKFANPLADVTLWITESNNVWTEGNLSDRYRFQNITVVEPLIPAPIADTGWNLVSRPVVPFFTSADVPQMDGSFNQRTGFGDATFFQLASPPAEVLSDDGDAIVYGFGYTSKLPIGQDDLSANQWAVGPVATALYSSKEFTVGFLAQQWWGFGGSRPSNEEDTSLLNFQYFAFWNFNPQWGLGMAPIATANWKADSGNVWNVPVGLGLTHTFKVAQKIPSRLLLEFQSYPVHANDYGPRWNIRLAWAMFLPSLFGKSED